MKIGPESWLERITEARWALGKEQSTILEEVHQLKVGCTNSAQLARLEALESRALKHAKSHQLVIEGVVT